MTLDPEFFKQQFATIVSEAETKLDPIHMLNMVRFRDLAEYGPDEAPSGPTPTGHEAYGIYSAHASAFVEAVGGVLMWMSTNNTTVIGPRNEAWDSIFTVQYPNRTAFVSMLTNPDYQAIAHHRTAALSNSRLTLMDVREV